MGYVLKCTRDLVLSVYNIYRGYNTSSCNIKEWVILYNNYCICLLISEESYTLAICYANSEDKSTYNTTIESIPWNLISMIYQWILSCRVHGNFIMLSLTRTNEIKTSLFMPHDLKCYDPIIHEKSMKTCKENIMKNPWNVHENSMKFGWNQYILQNVHEYTMQ